MRCLPFVMHSVHALAYSMWRHPRTGPSSRARMIPIALVSSPSSRSFTTSHPRSIATFLSYSSLSAVWNAIVNHPIVENPENPRLWSLHGDIKWIRGIQQLYNRPCYDDITKVVLSLTHALVIGTPGIGNTLYLQIFLVHLFRHAQAEGKDPPSIYYKYPGNGKITVVSFLPDGSVVDISNVLQPPRPDYLLSDGVDISHPSGKLLNLPRGVDRRTFELQPVPETNRRTCCTSGRNDRHAFVVVR